jgi:putative oxidoreductase
MLLRLQTFAYAALRIAAGILFVCHGLQKTLGLFGGQHAPLFSRLGAAGIIEIAAGTLIALGLWTRPLALLAAAEMAAAYYLVHFPAGRWPIQNGGELAVLNFFLFLYIATRGAGPVSIDGVRGKGR